MPNPGGIHLGCARCRNRKIKCDRGYPRCQRCIKYGAPCPGYPQPQDVRFRHQTAKIARRAGSTAVNHTRILFTPSSRKNVDRDKQEKPNTCHGQSSDSPSVVAYRAPSWDIVLSQYFFDQITMPVGWYSHLPQLYHRAAPGSCLNLTVSAASLFVATNQFHDGTMLHMARRTYGAALQSINASLAHPKKCLEDETLTSILLLNILDKLTGHSVVPSISHLNGCAQLLKMREERGFRTDRTHDLAHSIVIQTQPWLVQGVPVDDDTHGLLWRMTQTPAAELAVLSREVGKLRQDMFSSVLSLVEQVETLEAKMNGWRTHCELRWVPKDTTETQATYYPDIRVAKLWNFWRVSRIILHSTMIGLVDHATPHQIPGRDLNALRANSVRIINTMTADIAASIPFHLQQIDARGLPCTRESQRVLGGCALLWPLQMLLEFEWTPACQKIVALEALKVISNCFGVHQARMFLGG